MTPDIHPTFTAAHSLTNFNEERWTGVSGLRLAFSTMPVMLVVSMSSGFLLAFMLRDVRSLTQLIGWLTALAVVSGIRCSQYLQFRKLA